MNSPMFSIVIANYNYGRFLDEAIRSVLSQSYQDYEIIICDGGSTDNSVEVIKKYADKLAWWCSEKDKGQSDAFNKGFARARGRFLTWLNADDVFLPGAFEAVANAIEKNPECEWFTGGCVFCDSGLFVKKFFISHKFSQMRFKGRQLTVGGPSSFFTKRLLCEVGGLDVNLCFLMDIDLWYRFVLLGRVRYVRVKEYIWAFRFHDQSKTSGRVVSPDAEQSKLHNNQMEMEGRILQDKYGAPSFFWRLINRLPSSVVDAAIAYFETWKYKGRHVNSVFKQRCSSVKMLLSNAIQEYIAGLQEAGVEVFAFNNHPRKKNSEKVGLTLVNGICEASAADCATMIQRSGINVLYAQGFRSLLYFSKVKWYCRKYGRRPTLIVTCHSPALWDNALRSTLFMLCSCLLSDGIVFLVEKTRKKWCWLCALFGVKTYHIPNCIDLDRFIPKKPRPKDIITLGVIGSIGPRKCQSYLVDMVNALRAGGYNVRAKIRGDVADVTYKAQIEQSIKKYGLDEYVRVEPILSYDLVPRWMQGIDVYVCPSRAEVMPFSIIEAMASGLPVVAHDIAGIHEEVRNGVNGYLIRSSKISDYVNAVIHIIEKWEMFSRNARELAEREFSTTAWAKAMNGVVYCC